jgi:hypothetical protein
MRAAPRDSGTIPAWQTLDMRVTGEVLRSLGFGVSMRRHGLAWRLRRASTIMLLMGATGLAIGYTVVGRNRLPLEPDEADELG